MVNDTKVTVTPSEFVPKDCFDAKKGCLWRAKAGNSKGQIIHNQHLSSALRSYGSVWLLKPTVAFALLFGCPEALLKPLEQS